MNKYIGVPFADGTPSLKGANCYSLVELIYREELGIEIPNLTTLSVNSRRVYLEFLKQISENWIKIDEPELHCVVAMAYDMQHPKIVQHVGIYLGDGKVLHTINKINSHVVTLGSLKPLIKGYYKWRY